MEGEEPTYAVLRTIQHSQEDQHEILYWLATFVPFLPLLKDFL
jgi:hypothetical protein